MSTLQPSMFEAEEHARILELIDANTWPNKWTGNEIHGDVPLPQIYADGVQPLLCLDEWQIRHYDSVQPRFESGVQG